MHMFCSNVRSQVFKLYLKFLKCLFMGYSLVKKRYRCYCPTFRRYFVSTDVAFFETTMFSLSSTVTSPGGGGGGVGGRIDDDLLVYYVFLLVLTPALILVKPPITQVYP